VAGDRSRVGWSGAGVKLGEWVGEWTGVCGGRTHPVAAESIYIIHGICADNADIYLLKING